MDEQNTGGAAEPRTAPDAKPSIRLNTTNLKSSYCNVCNATSTREEVVLNFGLNESWDQGVKELEVQLSHRIIMSPQAAKRLQELLVQLIEEHQLRYGKLA